MADVREPRGNASPEKVGSKASPKEISDDAISDLAEAIILQAIHDLRVLRGYGVIAAKSDRVIEVWPLHPKTGKPRDMIDGFTSVQAAQDLISFFRPPTLDIWVILSGRKINPDVIRQKLNLPPAQ